jgi:hypothetical protein
MYKKILFILIIVSALIAFLKYNPAVSRYFTGYGAPPYIDDGVSIDTDDYSTDPYANWKRPDGPLRVGLQAGHWKTSEMPEEQQRIKDSGGGTSNGRIAEWEVNLTIAHQTAIFLESKGVVVDILPATVPVDYWADVFISIHADGNLDKRVNGFKVAGPRRDRTGRSTELAKLIEDEYAQATGLVIDPNISRNMTGYYAFNWRRYEHAVHPMTVSVIFETGFLTNPSDAHLLINSPEKVAEPLAEAVMKFLATVSI